MDSQALIDRISTQLLDKGYANIRTGVNGHTVTEARKLLKAGAAQVNIGVVTKSCVGYVRADVKPAVKSKKAKKSK